MVYLSLILYNQIRWMLNNDNSKSMVAIPKSDSTLYVLYILITN